MADIKRYMIPWTGKLIEKDDGDYVLHSDHLAAIKAAVAAEREACALIAETRTAYWHDRKEADQIADEIRARGAAHE